MADRRYSESDRRKMAADLAADLRARGADAREIAVVHPGGTVEGVRQIRGEMGATIDQSQEQTAKSREGFDRKVEGMKREAERRGDRPPAPSPPA